MQLKRYLRSTFFVMVLSLNVQTSFAVGVMHTIDRESLDKLEVIVQNGCNRLGDLAKQNLCRSAFLASGVLFMYWGARLIFEYLRPALIFDRSRTGSGNEGLSENQQKKPNEGQTQVLIPLSSDITSQQIAAQLVFQTVPSFYRRAAPYCVGVGSIGLGLGCFLAAMRL